MIRKIIIVCLLITCLCAQTATPPSAGDGSESNPYQIASLENLYWIAVDSSNWDEHYIQTADIDAYVTNTWFDGQGWLPIAYGISFVYFTGTYNGQEYLINNLYINRTGVYSVGLFCGIYKATIENIILRNLNVGGSTYVGGLVGYSRKSIIDNCYISGNIIGYLSSGGGGLNIGGLIGGSTSTIISNCTSSSEVNGDAYVGGIVGYHSFNNLMRNCISNGSVTARTHLGGLVGVNFSRIFNCINNANVSGGGKAGGIAGTCGEMDVTGGTIKGCINTGKIYGTGFVGGIAGIISNTIIMNCYNAGHISYKYAGGIVGSIYSYGESIDNCFSYGLVTGTAGGLIYENDFNLQAQNCYWDVETSGQTTSAGGTGKTTEEMKSLTTYSDSSWDFTEIWGIDTYGEINNGYPYLIWSENYLTINIGTNPTSYFLLQNYPNPFNPMTNIGYAIPEDTHVKLAIYNIAGRLIKQWFYQNQQAGTYEITWNGKDQAGNPVPSGVYIYSMVAGEFVESKKMVLLK